MKTETTLFGGFPGAGPSPVPVLESAETGIPLPLFFRSERPLVPEPRCGWLYRGAHHFLIVIDKGLPSERRFMLGDVDVPLEVFVNAELAKARTFNEVRAVGMRWAYAIRSIYPDQTNEQYQLMQRRYRERVKEVELTGENNETD